MDWLLPASPTVRLVIRMVLAAGCFVVAAVLSVIPGPAVVFWLAGFVLLGFSAGQILLSVHAVQELLHRHVPYANRLPRLRKLHIRRMLRHRWIRMLDRLSGGRGTPLPAAVRYRYGARAWRTTSRCANGTCCACSS
ncbi:MAG: hypothetical protein U0802_12090 [Candidatus Binatia bacterium]